RPRQVRLFGTTIGLEHRKSIYKRFVELARHAYAEGHGSLKQDGEVVNRERKPSARAEEGEGLGPRAVADGVALHRNRATLLQRLLERVEHVLGLIHPHKRNSSLQSSSEPAEESGVAQPISHHEHVALKLPKHEPEQIGIPDMKCPEQRGTSRC